MTTSSEAESFWDFSARTYVTKGVPEACLSLQDDHGADVNMVLYCCWIGVHFGNFNDELFELAIGFSEAWAENIVRKLRSTRTWMKQTGCVNKDVPFEFCMRLRERIKDIELDAEKIQQDVLASYPRPEKLHESASPNERLDGAVANLTRYSAYAKIDLRDDVRDKFAIILRAVLQDCNQNVIRRALCDGR
jgi:uncharacterized protein (TIGR02444 family)